MAEYSTTMLDRLDTIEERLRRLEERIDRREMREAAVQPWQYLVRRRHPWRQQLYIQGRNLTARQLVGSMRANQLDEDSAAADYRLPVEAVLEAIAYVEGSRELLETEAEIERLMLKRGGTARGPQSDAFWQLIRERRGQKTVGRAGIGEAGGGTVKQRGVNRGHPDLNERGKGRDNDSRPLCFPTPLFSDAFFSRQRTLDQC